MGLFLYFIYDYWSMNEYKIINYEHVYQSLYFCNYR